MRAHPIPPSADLSNVVNLSFYRRQKRLRPSGSRKPQALQPFANPNVDFWTDANYRDRMKVNAIVFVFLTFLVMSGVWLLDGLADAYAPERVVQQHSQPSDSVTAIGRLTGGLRDLF